jgi:pimeloyl-ACP methyl ester carboxylesterase
VRPPTHVPALVLVLALALLALAALPSCHESQHETKPTIALGPCWLPGVDVQARCGTFQVFEDRGARSGRTITLHVAVLPALAASPEPDPVMILAGGPGQGAISVARALLPSAELLRRSRDLVFVDQRGTGDSNKLPCELGPEDAPLADQLKDPIDEARIKGCLAKLDADPRMYTTPIAMDDLDDVRAALGYPALNLWGTSYGTRAALVYLRQHPDHVRTVILDGVAPMSLYLPLTMPRDAERAMNLLLSHCAADAACARAYPDLGARFRAFLAGLEKAPMVARVAHPRTGKVEEVTVDRDAFVGTLRSLLYLPEATSLVPLILDRAMSGDLSAFVTAAVGLAGGIDTSMALGMFFSVICAEDAPFFDDAALEREAAGTFVGAGPGRAMVRACKWWPRGELPAGYRDPVASDRPVLLLSGELDPVTPPSWAADAKKTLPGAVSLDVDGVGHNTTGVACVRSLMADFVKKGARLADRDPAALPARLDACAHGLKRPAFFTSYAGPEP